MAEFLTLDNAATEDLFPNMNFELFPEKRNTTTYEIEDGFPCSKRK